MESDDGPKTKIVVGLGNPGRRYARTRHNVGFRVVESLAQRWAMGQGRKAFGGLVHDGRVTGPGQSEPPRVLLLQPHTYMNCSGQSVKGLAAFYKVASSDLLVIMDDLALSPGRIRVRGDGTAGGHKGLADVQAMLGTNEIARLRVGIGPVPEIMDARDFVLTRFDEDEKETIDRAIALAVQAAEDWLFQPLADVMSRYNGIIIEREVADD